MSFCGAFKTLCLCGLLVGMCAGQQSGSAAAKMEIRPAIFQRMPQSLQIVTSQGTSGGQLSSASYHVASDAEVDGMEQTLEQYVVAFESLSLPQIKQVWPEVDSKHAKAFKDVFSAFKGTSPAPRLELQCAIPRVESGTANVECKETVTYAVGRGKTKEAGPIKVSIELKGQASRWVVRDMKGTG